MIQIWRWEVPLPPGLQFLSGPLGSAAATLVFWLLVAFLTQFVVLRVAKAIARRTESDIEDVIVDISRRPLVLAIILLGMVASLDFLELVGEQVEAVERWLIAAVMGVATYWLWRLLKEVVIHYGERIARRSETRVDDVLLPIVNQFAPIVLFVVGGAAILQELGVRLDALLVAIGGAAFILAFALQDILSNVFSGLSLLVDTPFRYGDLVRLEDGTVCQVVRIGVRVTQLYDIDAHAIIYMPNSKLANERLVNLMQPTPELISVLRLELAHETDVERAREVLNRVLDGHPDLMGEIEQKIPRIEEFSLLSEEKRTHGKERLAAELDLDRRLAEAAEGLKRLAEEITRSEQRGFTRKELESIWSSFEPLAHKIGRVSAVDRRLDAHRGDVDTFVPEVLGDLPADSVAASAWRWVKVWAKDPDIFRGQDDDRMRSQWAVRVVSLLRRTDALWRKLEKPDTLEQRLDDAVLKLHSWLTREFKLKVAPWKCSGASFKGYGEVGPIFSLFFLVDDIELEHFTRQVRVENQVRAEAARRLKEAGIEFAGRHYEVAFLQGGNGATPGMPALPLPLNQGSVSTPQ
jgi:MscS family membrane protein